MRNASQVIKARALLSSGTGKAIRERAGLSMAEFGGLFMEPPHPASTILRWEGGRSRPRPDSARAYLTALERVEKAIASAEKAEAS